VPETWDMEPQFPNLLYLRINATDCPASTINLPNSLEILHFESKDKFCAFTQQSFKLRHIKLRIVGNKQSVLESFINAFRNLKSLQKLEFEGPYLDIDSKQAKKNIYAWNEKWHRKVAVCVAENPRSDCNNLWKDIFKGCKKCTIVKDMAVVDWKDCELPKDVIAEALFHNGWHSFFQ